MLSGCGADILAPLAVVVDQGAVDYTVLVWMNNHRSHFLDQFFVTVTWAGSLAVLLPVSMTLLGWLVYHGKRSEAWLLGLGFGGAALITYIAKIAFGRPRPDLFPALTQMPADFSFPSAHTAQITAFCLCLLIIVYRGHSEALVWSIGIIGMVLIGIVGYSRLYLQVHYLSDVIAGILFSLVWVAGLKHLLYGVFLSSYP
jgi:undecaprenyl-diphosphatase